MKVTTRGLFAQQIKQRIAEWHKFTPSARIRVPEELSWWYWNEFGTASKAILGRGSGAPYSIRPNSAEMLAFTGRNGLVIAPSIGSPSSSGPTTKPHPGVRPSRSVYQSLPEIGELMRKTVHEALQNNFDNPQLVAEAMRDVAVQAVDVIADNMRRNLQPNGPRDYDPAYPKQAGKLQGRLAADVFKENAQVVVEEG